MRNYLGVNKKDVTNKYIESIYIQLQKDVNELRWQMRRLIDDLGYEFVRRNEYPEMDMRKVKEDRNVCTCCGRPKVPVPPPYGPTGVPPLYGPTGKVGP